MTTFFLRKLNFQSKLMNFSFSGRNAKLLEHAANLQIIGHHCFHCCVRLVARPRFAFSAPHAETFTAELGHRFDHIFVCRKFGSCKQCPRALLLQVFSHNFLWCHILNRKYRYYFCCKNSKVRRGFIQFNGFRNRDWIKA